MAVPEVDLARIRRFCEKQVPPEMRDQVRVEHRVRGRTVTIVEHRPPWNPALGPEWTDTPQARMKYDDLMAAGSMAAAKAAGKVRIEGKDYIMRDGDVVEFRFNV